MMQAESIDLNAVKLEEAAAQLPVTLKAPPQEKPYVPMPGWMLVGGITLGIGALLTGVLLMVLTGTSPT